MKIYNPLSWLIIFLVRFYQICVSPLLPNVCRFQPTCSAYTLACFKNLSFFKALRFSVKRLLRCHPFCEGGFDPPPVECDKR